MDIMQNITCRKAAVLSDVHSNYHALAACIDDAHNQGADCFIFLGDYISDLADPQKSLDLIYEIQSQYPAVCLRGNRERYMLNCMDGAASFQTGSKTGSLLYTYNQLRRQDFEFMEGLAPYAQIKLNGIPFEIAHAARDDDRYYFEAQDEAIQAIFKQMQHGYMLTGHSHRQYLRRRQGRAIVNPGSVGVPRDHGSLAQYAILEFKGGGVHCVPRQIPYDTRAMVRRQFESGLAGCAPHWAVSILYDALSGEDYTMPLLNRVCQAAGSDESAVHDERIWHQAACEMGMRFTEREILAAFGLG